MCQMLRPVSWAAGRSARGRPVSVSMDTRVVLAQYLLRVCGMHAQGAAMVGGLGSTFIIAVLVRSAEISAMRQLAMKGTQY